MRVQESSKERNKDMDSSLVNSLIVLTLSLAYFLIKANRPVFEEGGLSRLAVI